LNQPLTPAQAADYAAREGTLSPSGLPAT
jgi:hypothetical protein